jgi:DNA polymerase-4
MELPPPRPRIILCLDLDAFFASVEIADNPKLDDPAHPLAVGSPDPRRGVISTASYAARAFGVKAGMSTAEALRRCPDLKVVVPRHDRYSEVSDIVFDICRRVTPEVEPTSVDEGFLDATRVLAPGQDPSILAAELRRVIKAETGLVASIGIGSGKRIAKIACDQSKPDGILEIERGAERQFLAPLPVSVISGVGPKTAAVLAEQGIRLCRELAATDPSHLIRWFGPKAGWMRDAAAGIDEDPVESNRARRSLSAEITLEEDAADPATLAAVAAGLADEIGRRLAAEGLFARGVTLKLKDADFRTITRAASVPDGSDDPALIAAAVEPLIAKEAKGKRYRLVGLAATHLVAGEQLTLFGRAGEPPRTPAA